MNFYPFHIGDYAAHTRHLSFMEDLAYRRLIDQYYLDECPLKGEPSLIARRIGMSDFSSDVQYILETFFEKNGELWISKRCDDEIAKYQLKAESARNANRIKSAKNSALKTELKSEPNHIVTKNQEPITSSEKPKKRKTAILLSKNTMPENYEDFIRSERPDLDPLQTYYKFCDYWLGNGETKADWLATWRNWVRNEKKQFTPKIDVTNFDDMMRRAK